MLSKPCPRAGQPHCRGIITEQQPARLARRHYCSKSCGWYGKTATGWQSLTGLTREAQSRGGRIGAQIVGERRHRAALTRAVAACDDLIPVALRAELSAKHEALLKVLLGRAFQLGRCIEIKKADNRRRRAQEAQGLAQRHGEAA